MKKRKTGWEGLEDHYTRKQLNAAKRIVDIAPTLVDEILATAGGDVEFEMGLRSLVAEGILEDRAPGVADLKTLTRSVQ